MKVAGIEDTLYIFAGAFVVALITSLLMKAYIKKARAKMEPSLA